MLAWRVYYGDGFTFDSDSGSVADAPPLDVQAVVWVDPLIGDGGEVGRRITSACDFYVYRDGEWYGSDLFGMIDQVLHHPGCLVKAGRYMHVKEWQAILLRAKDDPDFRPKSAWAANERHP